MPLTDKAIRAASAREKIYRITDGEGMYLEVHPSGSKYWRLKYYFEGKERRLALGVYPAVSLAEAREARTLAKKSLRHGIDPAAEKKIRVAEGKDFKSYAVAWVEAHSKVWSPKYSHDILRRLEKDVFPKIGHKEIGKIVAQDVLAVGREVERRGASHKAKRTVRYVSQIFKWYIPSGVVTHNPASGVSEAIPPAPVKHNAYLREKDLPELLQKIVVYDGHEIVRCAIEFLMLTFVRTMEVRGMRWEEVDMDKAVWRIPPERMKMREEHIVPLSRQAIETLEAVRPYSRGAGLVFRSPFRTDGKGLSENTILYALYRMGYHSRMTGHGFRATASTVLNEHGFSADVIERQLAHSERSAVRKAYNHAQYLTERATMMQWWADFIDAKRPQQAGFSSSLPPRFPATPDALRQSGGPLESQAP